MSEVEQEEAVVAVFSIADLAACAVANNNTRKATSTPVSELSIEDARGKVVVKDGNRPPNPDGSQALTLRLGKHTLCLGELEGFAEKATRVNATKETVEGFTKALLAAVEAGQLDVGIKAAQVKAIPKPKAVKPVEEEAATTEASGTEEAAPEEQKVPNVDGIDLDSLDALAAQ